jgi:aspartate aminotransferase-like enzyme
MIFRDVLLETRCFGFNYCQDQMWKLGNKVRFILEEKGFKSVSAKAYQSPGVNIVLKFV